MPPAHRRYELEKTAGVAVDLEEFQHNVKRAIPKGYTFKAFPIQFSTFSSRAIMAACKKEPMCKDILGARGDHVIHGVHATAFAYPEETFAVWVMIATTYRAVL